jgi:hypothetical protein
MPEFPLQPGDRERAFYRDDAMGVRETQGERAR